MYIDKKEPPNAYNVERLPDSEGRLQHSSKSRFTGVSTTANHHAKFKKQYATKLPLLEVKELPAFTKGNDNIEAFSVALSAKDNTGRSHIDQWHKDGQSEPAGGVRYAAELVVSVAENWRAGVPELCDPKRLRATHLLLDAIATAAQTLRVQLAQAEVQAMNKAQAMSEVQEVQR